MTKKIERWSYKKGKFVKSSKKIEDFLADIKLVCEKHGLSISCEGSQTNFIIDSGAGRLEANIAHLNRANDNTE